MERGKIVQTGALERHPPLWISVLDKQRSFTVELMEDEQSLWEKKIKSDTRKRGDTPLHLAARVANPKQVKEVLGDLETCISKESIWKRNSEGQTALYIAAENGHVEVVCEILKIVNLKSTALSTDNNLDAFHIAAKLGHAEVLKELLHSYPGLVTTTDSSNATALYTAAAQGNLNIVNLLLETDENIARIVRNNGKTALHIAARMGHLEVVISLLAKDPTTSMITDRKGQTALHMAAKGQNAEIVQELLKNAPLVIDQADNKGNTPLHTATRKGRLQIIRTLLSFPRIDVNASNKLGETSLAIAEKYFNEQIAAILREAGGFVMPKKEEIEVQIEEVPPPPTTPHKLKQAASFIKQEVQSQLRQSHRTQMGVQQLTKKVENMARSGLIKASNSNIVVATLIASVAFAAIFQVPGQYMSSGGDGNSTGQAYIANGPVFTIFLLSDSLALFVSLAVVVAQMSLIVVDHKAMEVMVFVINKLMWACCILISVSFVSLSYVVIRRQDWWLAWSIALMAAMFLLTTLGIMCYFVVTYRVEQKEPIKKAVSSVRASYSWCPSLVSE